MASKSLSAFSVELPPQLTVYLKYEKTNAQQFNRKHYRLPCMRLSHYCTLSIWGNMDAIIKACNIFCRSQNNGSTINNGTELYALTLNFNDYLWKVG